MHHVVLLSLPRVHRPPLEMSQCRTVMALFLWISYTHVYSLWALHLLISCGTLRSQGCTRHMMTWTVLVGK